MIKTAPATLALIDSAERLLETGAYETALDNFDTVWSRFTPDQAPNLSGLNDAAAAAILLWCGIHYGFHGLIKKGAQEKSKDLLSAANNIFKDLRKLNLSADEMHQIIAEQVQCKNYLAISYWRMGDISNARAYLERALSLHGSLLPLNTARLFTFIVESLILHKEEKHAEIIEKLEKRRNYFLRCDNLYLLGHFYTNLGTAQKNERKFSAALQSHILAQEVFTKLQHRRFISYSVNNIACLYRAKGEFNLALSFAKQSLETAKKAGDVRQEGCVNETISSIYYAKGEFETALMYAEKSVSILETIECYQYLTDSYKTLIKTLWKLDRMEEADEVYAKAWNTALLYCGENSAKKLTRLLGSLQRKEIIKQTLSEKISDDIQLRFEEGFEPVGKVEPIQLATNTYSNLGFNSGSIVVAEETEVNSGNFVAAVYDEECYLGFLHSYEGMISLEINNELLFDPSSDVQILGKIIGYCPDPPDVDGYYKVVSFE